MRLSDGTRQIVAALLASAAFLAIFFGLRLVWWLALAMAVLVYGASLLLIGRRRPLEEIRLASRVSAADVAAAAEALDDARTRLERAAPQAPKADRAPISQMAEDVAVIRQNVIEDPDDYRAARMFISVYLPKIVQSVETYTRLSDQATGANAERVSRLGAQIRGFVPVVDRIRAACIENDLSSLELEVSVLSEALDRR